MKDLKDYIKESILDDIDDLIENNDGIKVIIIKWIKDNVETYKPQYESKFEFDFSTAPATVNIKPGVSVVMNKNVTSLTNGMFQWGEVEGDFNCGHCNSLTSLEGAPEKVSENFYCHDCNSLTSLEGAPKEVGKGFNCSCCTSLKSLEGAPEKVGKDFYCAHCINLKTLEGAPKEVGKDFKCNNCDALQNLDGAPKKVNGNFDCRDCGNQFTEDDVKNVCKVKRKIIVKW